MKVLIALLLFFAQTAPASTEADWEACLDAETYHLPLTMSFLADGSISKNGCEFRVVILGKASRKFAFNVCDSDISLREFDTVDGSSGKRFRATSANCSVPMFGIDIDVPESDAQAFHDAREQIFRFLAKAEKSAGSQTKQRLTCARVLFQAYLADCSSFEPKAHSASVTPMERKSIEKLQSQMNIPGIHPQTILREKE